MLLGSLMIGRTADIDIPGNSSSSTAVISGPEVSGVKKKTNKAF